MSRILMILEVSEKQNYIFSSKLLRENATRSACISYVTSSAFFETFGELYDKEKNFVYAGGGHTVLVFESKDSAMAFAQAVTLRVRKLFDGMELFVKQFEYDQALSPKQNLRKLSRLLEAKKALRKSSVRQTSFGIEKAAEPKQFPHLGTIMAQLPQPPDGYSFLYKISGSSIDDNFMAVIHIDGNSMGSRVSSIYNKPEAADWDSCCKLLNRFSSAIDRDFREVFDELCVVLAKNFGQNEVLPIRPIVLAGDDICFVTAGKIGLACADWMLKRLYQRVNSEDSLPYATCAGVAIVHKTYPFFSAYHLAENLCSNAKKFSAIHDENKQICAIDWHIEFSQIKDSLERTRSDYKTDDGDRLYLRPLACVMPEGVTVDEVRTFSFFRELSNRLEDGRKEITSGKIKELRTALRQGEEESIFYLDDRQMSNLLDRGTDKQLEIFHQVEGESKKRCLFFDAIEMFDRVLFFEEEV